MYSKNEGHNLVGSHKQRKASYDYPPARMCCSVLFEISGGPMRW